MNRARRLVNLAINNEIEVSGDLRLINPDTKLSESDRTSLITSITTNIYDNTGNINTLGFEDVEVPSSTSYEEKVYHYLQNIETGNKKYRTDPIEFNEINNESSPGISTDNFCIQSNLTGIYEESNQGGIPMKNPGTKILHSVQPSLITTDKPKVHILDYTIIPAKANCHCLLSLNRNKYEIREDEEIHVPASNFPIYHEETIGHIEALNVHEETNIPIINPDTKIPDSFETTLISIEKSKINTLDYDIFPVKRSNYQFDTNKTENRKKSKLPIYREETFESFSNSEKSDSLDPDFIPPSIATDSSSNLDSDVLCEIGVKKCNEDELVHENDGKEIGRNKETCILASKPSILCEQKFDSDDSNVEHNHPSTSHLTSSTEHKRKSQTVSPLPVELTTKKDLCTFCFEEVDHFARHLITKHSDEEAIKKICRMPCKSNERRNAIMSLRKKGNFVLNEQRNIVKVVRLPNKCNMDDQKNDEYFPCVSCLGFYKKSYLWRHRKNCKSKVKNETVGTKNHLTEAQTFLATTGMLGNFLNKSRLKMEVFNIMRPDEISYTAKSDSLICLFGESYINKHKRKQMNTVVSNKMRELARLKIVLKKSTTIEKLIDVLKPECYELIVAATKVMCGYDVETRTYKSSSLALHMGTSLKFLCDIATKAVLTKNPLFAHYVDPKKTMKEIKDVRHMIDKHWCNDVSSLANKGLNEQKFLKPKLLPFTEDIKLLNQYVKNSAESAYEKLSNKEDIRNNYKILSECTLVLVLIFNRKRVGEVQFLNIATYENSNFVINQKECLTSLTQFEKTMSSAFKRVVVFGKGSKPVPILFTKLMQRYIEMLLNIRKNTDIVPKSNIYVFANPDSKDRWMTGPSVLRKYAHKCGAKNPDLLTSTRFRKQLATILQIMNFENDEMEQIARFMGHTEKTHKEFYRLTEDVYQTAKVAKVLLLLNQGKGAEFKGKSLAEIEVTDDTLEYDVEEKQDKEDEERENEEGGNEEREDEDKEEEKNDGIEENGKGQEETDIKKVKPKSRNVKLLNKKTGRKRWAKNEKQLVLKYFQKHIKTKTVPKKNDCLIFIKKHSDLFSESDWVRIKTLVFNTYRKN